MKINKILTLVIVAIFASVIGILAIPSTRGIITSLASGHALSGSNYINLLYGEDDSNVYYDNESHTVTIESNSIVDKIVPISVDDKEFYGAGEENAIVLTIIVKNYTEKDMVVSLSDTTLANFDSVENVHAYAILTDTQEEFYSSVVAQNEEVSFQVRYVLLDTSKDVEGIISIDIVIENI